MAGKRHGRSFCKVSRKRKRVSIHVFAEILKKRMTTAEVILWKKLQYEMIKWGVKFESQGIVAGRYVADFVCREKRLIVELDGSIHRLARVRAKDKYRTMVLMRMGYTVVRFDNREVLNNCMQVVTAILGYL
jgi:5-methyltetrahydrofolate--homocysteine methyltransferase